MRNNKVWFYVGLIALATVSTSILANPENPEEVPFPPDATEQKQLDKAEWLIPRYYDKVGARLTGILANEKQPTRQRVQAAKRLGIMKYPAAIKTLIQNIYLLDPDIGAISGNESEPYVVINALALYGNAAVPQIIDSYLDETQKLRRHFLLYVILGGKTQKVATTYLTGLRAQNDERLSEARLKEFRGYVQVK